MIDQCMDLQEFLVNMRCGSQQGLEVDRYNMRLIIGEIPLGKFPHRAWCWLPRVESRHDHGVLALL